MTAGRSFISILFMLAGGGILVWLVAKYGPASLSAVSSIHLAGFILYAAAQLLLEFSLGLCWWVILPNLQASCLIFWWARMVRDGAGEFLPFSHLGGYVIAARAITLFRVPRTAAASSTIVDVSLETMAELGFVAFGLALLADHVQHSSLFAQVGLGLILAAGAVYGLIYLQQGQGHRWLQWAGAHILGQSGMQALELHLVQDTIDRIYRRQSRIALAIGGHFVFAFGTGLIGWVGFHILGSSISLKLAIAFEAMLHGILAFSFFIPGRLGVQEAAYIALGLAFGIPADIALSMSIVRRARNFMISVPILISWQIQEWRHLR